MRTIKLFLIIAALLFFAACTSNQEPKKETGQGDGLNILDSTRSQTSDTTAPGTNAAPYPGQTANDDTLSGRQ